MKRKIKNKVIKTATTPKKFPLTKSLGELMKDEDGFVSKETILKIGLSSVAALGIAGALTDITSGQVTTHTNVVYTNADNPTTTPVQPNCAQHTNVTTHTSY